MTTRYDYNRMVVSTDEAMEAFGYVNRDSFMNRVAKAHINYQKGKGRRPAMFSLKNISQLAKAWDMGRVSVTEEVKNRARMTEQEIREEQEEKLSKANAMLRQPVTLGLMAVERKDEEPYWSKKAKAIAELYDMKLDDVLNEAVRMFRDKITEAKE